MRAHDNEKSDRKVFVHEHKLYGQDRRRLASTYVQHSKHTAIKMNERRAAFYMKPPSLVEKRELPKVRSVSKNIHS